MRSAKWTYSFSLLGAGAFREQGQTMFCQRQRCITDSVSLSRDKSVIVASNFFSSIDYISHAVLLIPMTFAFHNWKSVSLTFIHLPIPLPLPSGNCQFVISIYRSDSTFCLFAYLFCFVLF